MIFTIFMIQKKEKMNPWLTESIIPYLTKSISYLIDAVVNRDIEKRLEFSNLKL